MSSPFVRHEVRSLPPGDKTLHAYSEAVRVMQERPAKDPTSWSYQAAIHGSEAQPALPLWNQCKHGTWYFVAWHRMFLYYFELIVREAVHKVGGPKDWTIPYWDYGRNGAYASLPDAFRNPTNKDGSKNHLYVQERAPGVNGGAILPAAATSATVALSRPQFTGVAEFGGGVAPPNQQFWSQTGRLEQTPHNVVHSLVGGTGWMGNPDKAAKDPIFWLHHSNIDRLWALWNAKKHLDPSEGQWANQSFKFFDVDGTQVTKTCAEVMDTIKDLDYTYYPPPARVSVEQPVRPGPIAPEMPSPTSKEPKVVGAASARVTLTGSTAAIPVEVDERARQEVSDASRASDPRRLYLNIEDIEGEVNPGSVYGVYVNLPEAASGEELEQHHVTNVSFFGIERARNPRDDEHSHSLRVSVDVGHILSALGEDGRWDGKPIDVTFRPLTLSPGEDQTEEDLQAETPGEHPPVQIGRVSLSVE
jgi:tyrosinase